MNIREKIKKIFFENVVTESSLSRVWKMAEQDRVFAIITAFRGEFSLSENKKRNAILKNDIRDSGFGFFELHGVWIENEGTPEEKQVLEESFFISLPLSETNTDKLIHFCKQVLNKWQQEAVLIKPEPSDNSVYLLFNSGDLENIGTFHPDKIATNYSRLKNGKTFVFKEATCNSWVGSIHEQIKKKRKSKQVYWESLLEVFTEDTAVTDEKQEVLDLITKGKWETDPTSFYESLKQSKHQEMLTDYSVSDLAKMKLFKVPGYNIGFALKKFEDKGFSEIVAVHNNSEIKGIGVPLMQAAIREGGHYLDHFDGFLTGFYDKLGFKEYKRDPYNPEYDPDGSFADKYGKVDVIYRKYSA